MDVPVRPRGRRPAPGTFLLHGTKKAIAGQAEIRRDASSIRVEASFVLLSKQYNRCKTCHYSPTGGGLLTPYGRSLSRQELSTIGRSQPGDERHAGGEEAFLWGALGSSLGPVSVGIELRPAHHNLDFGGTTRRQDFFMNADLLPRTHWNADVSYYRDRPRPSGLVTKTFLAQLHWYL